MFRDSYSEMQAVVQTNTHKQVTAFKAMSPSHRTFLNENVCQRKKKKKEEQIKRAERQNKVICRLSVCLQLPELRQNVKQSVKWT